MFNTARAEIKSLPHPARSWVRPDQQARPTRTASCAWPGISMRRVGEHAHLIRHGTALANAPVPNSDASPGFDDTRIAIVDRLAQGDLDASWIPPITGDSDQLRYLPVDDG